VLDADDQGREPKIDERTLNELFNPKSMSCLRCIAESDDKGTTFHRFLSNIKGRFQETAKNKHG